MILLVEISFTKQEITKLLNINPNEKNIKRILKYMGEIFEKECFANGRGKGVVFTVMIDEKSMDYINLKLLLKDRYRFKTAFDYDLCLKLIYFLMNNKKLMTLKEIAFAIDEEETNVKYYRDKMLNDLINRQDLCKQQIYSDANELIDIDIYDSIERTFKHTFRKICNSNQKNDYLEVYYLDKGVESDYQVVGVNDINYEDIIYSLESKGYNLVEKGYLYTNGSINKYFKDKLYQLHLNLYGYNYLYIKSIYTLSPRFAYDNEFKQLVTNAMDYYNKK